MEDNEDIIKVLRQEEEKGLLRSSIQSYDDELISRENTDVEETSQTKAFFDEKSNEKEINTDEELANDIDLLKQEIINLKDKLKESNERYNSLYEYFEIISDTTIALGKKDLFSDVSDVIFQVSPKGKITYINGAIEPIAGYTSSILIGEDFSTIIPKEDWKKVHKIFFSGFMKKERINRELNSFESFIITHDGKKIPVEINGKLIKYNVEVIGRKNEVRIQGSIRDITERLAAEEERVKNARRIEEMNNRLKSANADLKKAQNELKLLNQDLEKKVDERTEEIQKLLKHKIEFIGQLGHDLKTPLTPLVGLIPTIKKREKDPELKELLDVLNRNALFMRDIVVKTLKLERLNSPKLVLNFQETNIHDCINRLISNKEYIFKEKELTVKNNVSKDLSINIASHEFDELIDNLLSNAVKFTPKGGKIILDSEVENDFIKISISDTGIGLTEDQIVHVFDDFYKVDDSRHELDSSGLGLSICKRIVEWHKGNIWVESQGLEKGCTFSFTISNKLKNN